MFLGGLVDISIILTSSNGLIFTIYYKLYLDKDEKRLKQRRKEPEKRLVFEWTKPKGLVRFEWGSRWLTV